MESREGFVDDVREEAATPRVSLPTYKVWNANPKSASATPTPGIVMTTTTGRGEEKTKNVEVVQTVKAVILFRSPGRRKNRGSGATFRTECESHGYVLDGKGDKMRPSLKIQEPLCRKATAQDLAQTFSQWKGYDQAKVDAKIQEVTDGTGQLQVCGLKTSSGGFIPLCPKVKWNDGDKPTCSPYLHVAAYDVERKRQFRMELTGRSMQNDNKFISPFFEFFKFLRKAKTDGATCFEYTVELAPLQNGAFYLLDVRNYEKIEDEKVLAEMEHMALESRERWMNQASWLPKEQYEAQKVASQAQPPETPVQKAQVDAPASFDEDDIPF